MKSVLEEASRLDTRAYFPSREEAERFARQFDGTRYSIAILPEPRQGREVFQVHVQHMDHLHAGAPTDLLRQLRTMGDRARGAGLDGDDLARRMGRALGEVMASNGGPKADRRAALDHVGALLQQCGLGGLRVVSVTPLVLRVEAPLLGSPARGRRCAHVAGFLEGALGALLGKVPEVRELDCVGLGNAYCTFACEP